MRRGAFDFLARPFTPAQVRAVLERVERFRELRDRVDELSERVRAEIPEAELDSPDPKFRRAVELLRAVAPTEAVVLLRGETGTGKGVFARALHSWGRRATGPFVTVRCQKLGAEPLESELFGHAQGASTGAVGDAVGRVAAAEGGTLFLDEVGDLPPALQPKLIRLLQERRYEPVGESGTRAADVRIVAATSRDLEAAVASGAFREDLLYRLNIIEVTLPPLRERSDVTALAEHLLAFFASRSGRTLSGFTPQARDALRSHCWPGNLRELRNAVERAAILAAGPEVGLADLPVRVAGLRRDGTDRIEVGQPVSLRRLEEEHIRRVLAAASSLDAAARVLEIDPSTLYRKRKLYGF
jgi:NtrC-family two-component system response regulator AlgB